MTDSDALERRVKVLEGHNRSLRWTVLLTLVLSIVSLMWGRIWPPNGVVEASAFVVVDDEGKPRGSLGYDRSGVGLNLQDDRGLWRAGFLVDVTGRPAIFLFDTAAQPVVTLNLQRSGSPSMRLRNADNSAMMQLNLGVGVQKGLFLTSGADTVAMRLK